MRKKIFIVFSYLFLLVLSVFAKEKILSEELCKDISRIQRDFQLSEVKDLYDPYLNSYNKKNYELQVSMERKTLYIHYNSVCRFLKHLKVI